MFWVEAIRDDLEDIASFLAIEICTYEYTTTNLDIWLFEFPIIKCLWGNCINLSLIHVLHRCVLHHEGHDVLW